MMPRANCAILSDTNMNSKDNNYIGMKIENEKFSFQRQPTDVDVQNL